MVRSWPPHFDALLFDREAMPAYRFKVARRVPNLSNKDCQLGLAYTAATLYSKYRITSSSFSASRADGSAGAGVVGARSPALCIRACALLSAQRQILS